MGVETVQKDDLEIKLNAGFLKKFNIVVVLLIVFAIVLLKFLSVYDGGMLSHPAPYNYLAGDMFAFSTYAEFAKYENDLTVAPPYISEGEENIVITFSMIGPIISAQLSQFTGVETYDFIIHINILFIILSALIIFQFLYKIDKKLAFFSLPLALLVFKWPFLYTITWGMHVSNVNLLFVAVSLLCLAYLDKKYVFIVLGIMNGAGFLAHARETLMFNTAIALYFFARLLKEKILVNLLKQPSLIKTYLHENKTIISLKNYLFSIPIMLLMMFRYIPILSIFLHTKSAAYVYGESSNLISWMPPWLPSHVWFKDFGFYQYIIFAGAIVALFCLIFQKNRTLDIIASFAIMFMFNGFFSVLGNKTTQIRHLFPILLMPLVGLALFFIYNSLKKPLKNKSEIVFVILFVIMIYFTAANHMPSPISDYAFSDPYTWNAFTWVKNNVADNEKVLILYGDRHNQETMFYMMRKVQFRAWPEEYLKKVSTNILNSTLFTKGTILAENFRKTESGEITHDPAITTWMNETLCSYNYVYSDKLSSNSQIQKYTLAMLEKLIKENNFSVAYQNELVVVLKNNNVGGKCFEDEVLV